MIISSNIFGAVVVLSLVLVAGAPLILIALLIRDWRRKRLW
jgi:hypothetical protein